MKLPDHFKAKSNIMKTSILDQFGGVRPPIWMVLRIKSSSVQHVSIKSISDMDVVDTFT